MTRPVDSVDSGAVVGSMLVWASSAPPCWEVEAEVAAALASHRPYLYEVELEAWFLRDRSA